MSGSNVIGEFDSHAFPPIEKRNPVEKRGLLFTLAVIDKLVEIVDLFALELRK